MRDVSERTNLLNQRAERRRSDIIEDVVRLSNVRGDETTGLVENIVGVFFDVGKERAWGQRRANDDHNILIFGGRAVLTRVKTDSDAQTSKGTRGESIRARWDNFSSNVVE